MWRKAVKVLVSLFRSSQMMYKLKLLRKMRLFKENL